MSNFFVFSCNTPEYTPLAALTWPTKIDLAERHGYTAQNFPMVSDGRVSWQRVEVWRRALELTGFCGWTFFTGSDAFITNPCISLDSIVDPALKAYYSDIDLIIAADGNGLQCDSWLMRASPRSRRFLERLLDLEGRCANEQDAMSVLLSACPSYGVFCERVCHETGESLLTGGASASPRLMDVLRVWLNKSPMRVHVAPQRCLNAYPVAAGYAASAEQGWRPGDFVCHLPAMRNELRMEWIPKLLWMQ